MRGHASSSLNTSPVLEKWFFELQGLENEGVNSILLEIRIAAERLIAISSDSQQLQAVSGLAAFLPELQPKLQGWISALPDTATFAAEFSEGLRAYKRAQSLIGSDLDSILQTGRPSSRDLIEASNLLQREDLLRAMPTWVWSWKEEIDRDASNAQLYRQLVLPQVGQTVVSALSAAGESSLPEG